MKSTKLKLTSLAASLLFCFQTKAQTVCDNLLNCDVTIFYEMFELDNNNFCVSACSGTLLIPAGMTGVPLPPCANECDVCIIITGIGGWTPPSNHSSNSQGHIMTPYGQTGVIGAGACTAGNSFTAMQNPGNWVIQ